MESIENAESKEVFVNKQAAEDKETAADETVAESTAAPEGGQKKAPASKGKMKTRTKVLIPAAALLVAAAILVAIFVFGAPPQLAPDAALVAGDTISVRVRADQVENLYGYEFKLYFDESLLEYKSLHSSIEDITFIFQKPFQDYIRVGATKVGEVEGSSGKDILMCEVVLTVLQDGPLPEITMEEVSVVDSAQEYTKGIDGWSLSVAATDAA